MTKPARKWKALVLAAGRGPDDPMARAFGVSHKCLLKVGGKPMLARVVSALQSSPRIGRVYVSIEDAAIAREAFGGAPPAGVSILPSAESAAASVIRAVETQGAAPPVLVTPADHALLDTAMIEHVLAGAESMPDADLAVGMVERAVIEAAYPEALRTWMKLGEDSISACNLFAFSTLRALNAVRFWRDVEKNRKKPWRIALAFGIRPLIRMLLGHDGLEAVFAELSRRLKLTARPVLMPMAEAAIDVDKPADYELVERILRERR